MWFDSIDETVLIQNCFVEFLNLQFGSKILFSKAESWDPVDASSCEYYMMLLFFFRCNSENATPWSDLGLQSLKQSQAQPGCEKLRGRLTMY